MVKDKIRILLQEAVVKLGVETEVTLDVPTQKGFGDYATSIALKLTNDLKKSPLQIADDIVKKIPKNDFIKKIEVIKPGFINLWISETVLSTAIAAISEEKMGVLPFHFGSEKKVMVEFAHPNTHKLFHIGHMRNITTGETIVRLLEKVGNKVIRTNYQGDVGLHIAKCLYQIKKEGLMNIVPPTLHERIKLLGKAYMIGQQLYESDAKIKEDIHAINKMIYEKDKEIIGLWKETVMWSLQYFEEIYKRVGSHFDKCYFESDMADRGVKIVNELLKKNILEKSEGAVIFNGKQYGLDTRVFINSLGFPTYEGKELALAEKEFPDFGIIDKCIHVVTPEQTSFFAVTFKVEELRDEKKYKNKQYHLAYNWVNLKSGKMSSRTGNVVEGMWMIDEAKKILMEKYNLDTNTAEVLALASVKYSFLKVSPQVEIGFDFNDSISLEGNSGPYLIYTYVRTRSILKKHSENLAETSSLTLGEPETVLARKIYQFPEKIYDAASKLSPNTLCTYLFELAQEFNIFYQKNPILKSDGNIKRTRLQLTKTVGIILQEGLRLLGIQTVEKM